MFAGMFCQLPHLFFSDFDDLRRQQSAILANYSHNTASFAIFGKKILKIASRSQPKCIIIYKLARESKR